MLPVVFVRIIKLRAIMIDGNIKDQNFLTFSVTDNQVQAVASMNRDKGSNQIEEMML